MTPQQTLERLYVRECTAYERYARARARFLSQKTPRNRALMQYAHAAWKRAEAAINHKGKSA